MTQYTISKTLAKTYNTWNGVSLIFLLRAMFKWHSMSVNCLSKIRSDFIVDYITEICVLLTRFTWPFDCGCLTEFNIWHIPYWLQKASYFWYKHCPTVTYNPPWTISPQNPRKLRTSCLFLGVMNCHTAWTFCFSGLTQSTNNMNLRYATSIHPKWHFL